MAAEKHDWPAHIVWLGGHSKRSPLPAGLMSNHMGYLRACICFQIFFLTSSCRQRVRDTDGDQAVSTEGERFGLRLYGASVEAMSLKMGNTSVPIPTQAKLGFTRRLRIS